MTQKERVLKLLEENPDGITGLEFSGQHSILGYRKIISELRAEGHNIQNNEFRYHGPGAATRVTKYILHPDLYQKPEPKVVEKKKPKARNSKWEKVPGTEFNCGQVIKVLETILTDKKEEYGRLIRMGRMDREAANKAYGKLHAAKTGMRELNDLLADKKKAEKAKQSTLQF